MFEHFILNLQLICNFSYLFVVVNYHLEYEIISVLTKEINTDEIQHILRQCRLLLQICFKSEKNNLSFSVTNKDKIEVT